MEFETPEELANKIADWLGIYGTCKSDGESGCELNPAKPFCCRSGFCSEMEDRIREAVKNEENIKKIYMG